jgi:DNA helicase-2/ATP-dependent DNA helicase PcrA
MYRKHIAKFKNNLESLDDLRHEKGAYKGEIKGAYKPLFRKIENSVEFAMLYEKYQAELEERRLYDFEDMIIEVLRELRENKNLLLELQETYQYILADEHQDANGGQNSLLELLSGFHAEQPNLFVVGDEKQAIFRFQGASLENFLYFKKRFPQATVISLSKNYRSTQGILDASHSLIQNSPVHPSAGERVKLESKDQGVAANMFVLECDSPQAEAEAVATRVAANIAAGIPADQHAVLFRNNHDADLIARIFDARRIPYVLHTDIDVIADEHIQKLVFLLRAVSDFGNNQLLTPVLFIDFLKLDHFDAFKVLKRASETRKNVFEIIKSKSELEAASVEHPDSFLGLYDMLRDLSIAAKNKSLIDSLQEIVAQTGFVGFILGKHRATDYIAAYDALLSHIVELFERQKNAKLADYLLLLDKMKEHGVSVRAKSVTTYPGRVNLMTAHRSKGLEFDYVFCMNLNDGKWGGRKSHSYFLPITAVGPEELETDMSDERRLLYVALTRARKEVVLTYATHSVSGREMLPSRFLEEIDKELVVQSKETRNSVDSHTKTQALRTAQGADATALVPSVKDQEYISTLFLEQGFSVSALNNYLTCPWRFFFLNLIRIPQTEERFQLYGTAIHESLKVFFDHYKEEKVFTKKELLEFFENFLNRKAISDTDYKLFLKKGRESLGGYYDEYKGTWIKNIFNEFKITGVHIPVTTPDGRDADILLRGQLDKVEFLGDGSSVNVVDYKTGNPKSRREIEGETKSSDGNYKRQLVFYKLIIDRFDPARFSMKTGEIDFVEPNKQGAYKRERFEVTDAEVDALVEEIKKAGKEIIGLEFWNKRCDDDECQFCHMRSLLDG